MSNIYATAVRSFKAASRVLFVNCSNNGSLLPKKHLTAYVGWLILIPAKTLLEISKASKRWEECIIINNRLSLCNFFKF